MHYLCRKCALRLGSPEALETHICGVDTISVDVDLSALIDLDGIDDVRASELSELGINTPEQVAEMTIADLKKLRLVGDATAKKILASAKDCCGSNS
jgi:hypothetical protein